MIFDKKLNTTNMNKNNPNYFNYQIASQKLFLLMFGFI